jgi:hypothetical protein
MKRVQCKKILMFQFSSFNSVVKKAILHLDTHINLKISGYSNRLNYAVCRIFIIFQKYLKFCTHICVYACVYAYTNEN